jgi:hypothetical protein
MASLPVRDPVADHLLTPQNSALAGGRTGALAVSYLFSSEFEERR